MNRGSLKLLSAGAMLVAATYASPRPARAATGDDKPVEGVIVKVADGEVILDLGHREGLPDDARVRVYRRVEVTHPVTGKKVVDRFPIGTMRLSKVGQRLSIATNAESLERLPSVGDFVVFDAAPAAPKASAPPNGSGRASADASAKSTAESTAKTLAAAEDCNCQPSEVDPALAAVDKAFQRSLGRTLTERIDIWSKFLAQHPDTPYATEIDRELTWLRQRRKQRREASEELFANSQQSKVTPLEGSVAVPETISPGQPLEIVATFDEPARVQQVRLLTRRDGQPGYDEHLMERAGDRNWRVELDQEAERSGEIKYFVEAVRDDNELQTISGSAPEPKLVTVRRRADDPAERADRSKATALFEYVNFKSGAGTDEYLRFESDYRYWIGAGILDALAVGVGIFDGAGGSVEAIERGEKARDLSVSYGFAELQFGLGEYVGVSGRLLVGDRQSDSLTSFDDTFGLRSELRLGRRDDTRLELGYAYTDGIGNEAWIKLAVDEIERIPMSGEVVVTNLPVGEDLGVMLTYASGYQFTDWFALMARVGWNARTITYQGPTVGLGTELNW